MRLSPRSTLAAAVMAASATLAACGASPLEPTAAKQPQNLSGFVVNWGQKANAERAAAATAQPKSLSGFVVNWGSKKAEPAVAKPKALSGFVVNWGKNATATNRNMSGYMVSTGRADETAGGDN